jgi:signal transduction histidine kinase
MAQTIFDYLPRGNMLEDGAWRRRHRILLRVLALHIPLILVFALIIRAEPGKLVQCLVGPVLCLVGGYLVRSRRPASIIVTAGLTWCSAALVLLSGGSIEAHFHFFIIVGFIALYQDWIPFLWNILFTVVSHGIGSALPNVTIFNHPAAQASPWVWSVIHGAGVLATCVGLVIFWRVSEEDQQARARLAQRLAEAEVSRRQFTSDLLINLARRNQSMLYRQLEIINQLEEKERDPDALGELFELDHLATRVRRNAESLLVLSGEVPSRVWDAPVPLREVVQAAIAETEDLARIQFTVDERLSVVGNSVTDITHLLAELVENAVRFSPPETQVTIGVRPLSQPPGAQVVTIEDWGLGMPPERVQETNQLLAHPPEVDLSVAQRLGFHVVARLARRHGIEVSVTPTPGSGLTAIVVLPPSLFAVSPVADPVPGAASARHSASVPRSSGGAERGAGNGRPLPARSWRPPTPESAPSELSALAEIAVERATGGSRDSGRWDGWWRVAEPLDPRMVPGGWSEAAARRTAHDGSVAPGPARPDPAGDGAPRLSRRRPQSHLAPELLEPGRASRSRAQPTMPDPRPASEALSRYQASRQAAQVDTGRPRPPTNGGDER